MLMITMIEQFNHAQGPGPESPVGPSSRVWLVSRINHHPLKTPSYKNGHKCRIVQPSVVAAIWSFNPRYRST